MTKNLHGLMVAGLLLPAVCGCAGLEHRLGAAPPDVRRRAGIEFRRTSQTRQQDILARQLPLLKSGDKAVRSHASAVLASIGRPAIPGLLELAKSTEPAVVRASLGALGDMQAEAADAVPELIRLMDERGYKLEGSYLEALVNIGEAASPALAARASGTDSKGSRAREALLKIGAPAAKAVGEAFRIADRNGRMLLAVVLLDLGRKGDVSGALPGLGAYFAEEGSDKNLMVALMVNTGAPAVPWLLARLAAKEQRMRVMALDALQVICSGVDCGLQKYIPQLKPVLGDEDKQIRERAWALVDRKFAVSGMYRELFENDRIAGTKVPCPVRERWGENIIPADSDYLPPNEMIALQYGETASGGNSRVYFKVPDCGFSKEELSTILIRRDSGSETAYLRPTLRDSVVSVITDRSGRFSPRMLFRVADRLGPVLGIKYNGAPLPPGIAQISSSIPLEITAVDRSSYPFAIAGIGGVYAQFTGKPWPPCKRSEQDPKAPFGSKKNCIYKGPFLVPEGLRQLTVYTFDKVRNPGDPITVTVYSDATPPEDVFRINDRPVSPGATVYASASDVFSITSVDKVPRSVVPGSIKTFMRVDINREECAYSSEFSGGGVNGAWSCENPDYTGPFRLPRGEYSVYFLSEDAAGNMSGEKSVRLIVSGQEADGDKRAE